MSIKPENLAKHLRDPKNRNFILDVMSIVLETDLKYKAGREAFDSEAVARSFLVTKLANKDSEVFGVMYMDNHLNLIEFREEFFGTINSAHIHPRNIVKSAIELNASKVILSHNHPSGSLKVSESDISITEKLETVLAIIDVKVVDHIIVSKAGSVSMAQEGLV